MSSTRAHQLYQCSPVSSRPASSRCVSQSSNSFRALISPKALKCHILPKFLQPSDSPSPQSAWPFAEPSPSTEPSWYEGGKKGGTLRLKSPEKEARRAPVKAKVGFCLKEDTQKLFPCLVEEIQASGKSQQEPILRFRSLTLYRGELQALLANGAISKSVMDGYFKLLKEKNRERLRLEITADRVKLFTGRVALGVFSQGKAELVHSTKNIFKFDFLLFPIFVGHWTLLEVSMREKTVVYLDPRRERANLNAILKALFLYLRSELMFHENRPIENTAWSELRYKSSPEGRVYSAEDSGGIVATRAYVLCTGKPAPEAIRDKILTSLRKKSDALWS